MSTILGAGTDGGTITQVFSGLAACLAAFGAYRLNKRDNDAEDFKKLQTDYKNLKTNSVTKSDFDSLQQRYDDLMSKNRDILADLLTVRNYAFQVRSDAAAQGIATADPPHLLSEDW